MAVAHDALGGSGSWNTATEETWTHSPSGTPKGIAVLISQNGNGDQISGVTYGGVTMRRVWYMQRTATETCATYVYVLESGIPTGNQTVGATSTGTLIKAARSVSVTASGNVMLAALNFGQGLAANPSLAIDAAAACELYYVNASGLNTPVSTPESGTTQLTTQDLGSISAHWGRKSSDGSSTTIGWTSSSDDFSHIAFGFREAVGPQSVPFKSAYGTSTSPKDVVVPDCLDGDLLVVEAMGDNGVSGDSVTAVTTTTQSGSTGSWTEEQESIGTINEVWLHGAWAEVTADGSVTVRLTRTMTGTARIFGFTVHRVRNHGGIGNSATTTDGAAEVVNMAVSANSLVLGHNADWDAAAVATAWVPPDGIAVHRVAEGDITFHSAYWLGQASGTRDYGSSGSSGGGFRVIAIEVLEASAGTTITLDLLTENDTILSPGLIHTMPQLIENDTIFNLGKVLIMSQLVENDTIFALDKALTMSLLTENDTIFDLLTGTTIVLDLLTENDSIFNLDKILTLGLLTENNTVFNLDKMLTLGLLTENDSILNLNKILTLGLLTENDTIFDLVVGTTIVLDLLTENDSVFSLDKIKELAHLIENDTIFNITVVGGGFEPVEAGTGSVIDKIMAGLVTQGFVVGSVTDREVARLKAKLALSEPVNKTTMDLYRQADERPRIQAVDLDG